MTERARDNLSVTIARSDRQAQRNFSVQYRRPMAVLDVLLEVQRWHDPTLAFRWSCRIAMCGTCTVRVDGRPVLACQTPVESSARAMTIEPLGGFPVVRDLIVDPQPFYERWQQVGPAFRARAGQYEPASIAPQSAERQTIDPLLDCINCGACYAACATAASDASFIGPAALARGLALVADSRDAASGARLVGLSSEGGIDSCHQIGACTAVCPKGVDPARAVRLLRRRRLGLGR